MTDLSQLAKSHDGCTCMCHKGADIRHFFPCCPDLIARIEAAQPSEARNAIITREIKAFTERMLKDPEACRAYVQDMINHWKARQTDER